MNNRGFSRINTVVAGYCRESGRYKAKHVQGVNMERLLAAVEAYAPVAKKSAAYTVVENETLESITEKYAQASREGASVAELDRLEDLYVRASTNGGEIEVSTNAYKYTDREREYRRNAHILATCRMMLKVADLVLQNQVQAVESRRKGDLNKLTIEDIQNEIDPTVESSTTRRLLDRMFIIAGNVQFKARELICRTEDFEVARELLPLVRKYPAAGAPYLTPLLHAISARKPCSRSVGKSLRKLRSGECEILLGRELCGFREGRGALAQRESRGRL